jgi:hypothetical protein
VKPLKEHGDHLKQIYVPEHYNVLLTKVTECAARTPKSAVSYLSKNVAEYLKKKIEASSGQEKTFFETSHNLVSSYVDGLNGGDITVKDLKQLRRDLEESRSKFETELAEKQEKEKLRKAKLEGQSQEADTKDQTLEDLMRESQRFDHGQGAAEVYRKYAKYKKEMPRSIKGKPYMAIRMPIVVITAGIPDILRLRRTGLCDDMLFGYPILKNQVLIGMNDQWLKENFGERTKTSIRKDGEKNVKYDFDSAAAAIISDIRKKTNRQFVAMDGVHGFDSPDIMWMWFASSQDLGRLNGTTGTSTFSVREWTLPFENQMKKLKPRKT